jgi:hypothetical protein
MTKRLLLANSRLLLFVILMSACIKSNLPADFYGTWTVVAHREPGISAMNRDELNAWLGKKLHFSILKASLPSESCEFPVYNSETMTLQEFQSEFHFMPTSLDYTGRIIEIINISCKNAAWAAPGSTLIWLEKERLYMIWDGVFFRLQKQ